MCGIGGILNSDSIFHKSSIRNIANKVSFRGPDFAGIRIYNGSFVDSEEGINCFFHNRLSILDLDARSNQPFENERYTLVYNGEIYNYMEIRKDLEDLGFDFTTSSDTEVLFKALIAWHENALNKLNGMFSFFWLDRKERFFLMARDRTGIKPLYYRFVKGALIFASEIDSVIRLSRANPELSQEGIFYYLNLQYVPAPNTAVKEIRKLIPGSFIQGSISDLKEGKTFSPVAFWDAYQVAKDAVEKNESEKDNNFEKILVSSVKKQLQSDVPLGLFLSSGVDSSLLASVIHHYFAKDRQFDFFTVAFDEKNISDESEDAEAFLKGFDNPFLHHHKLFVNPEFISSRIEQMYDFFDEPFGDPTALLNWAIAEKAREHVTVVLSGDGADEFYWGYPRYVQWLNKKRQFHRKVSSLKYLKMAGSNIGSHSLWKSRLLKQFETDPLSIYLDMLKHPGFGFLKDISADSDIWFLNGIGSLKQRDDLPSLLDIKSYLPDAMNYKVDRSSMAVSLEVRVPYIDNEVIDHALRMPLLLKSTKKYKYKSPLKELLVKLAPQYPINRYKKGFNFPLSVWLKGKWKDMVLSLVTRDSLRAVGIDPNPCLKMIDDYYKGKSGTSIEIWYLLNLILWQEKLRNIKITE